MVRVFKTNYKFDSIQPWWDAETLSMTEFCNNNKFLPVRFSVYSYSNSGEHHCYGRVTTTTRAIEMLPDETLELTDDKGKVGGTITFNQFQMDMRPSLVEYLKHGWQMQVSIGIDFTLSNLEVTDPRSLHKISIDGDMNQYEKALFEVCNVMSRYTNDGEFYLYGFGGIPHYIAGHDPETVSRLWNLNGKTDARVNGTMEVLKAYQKAQNATTLAGPSYFSNLLAKIKS